LHRLLTVLSAPFFTVYHNAGEKSRGRARLKWDDGETKNAKVLAIIYLLWYNQRGFQSLHNKTEEHQNECHLETRAFTGFRLDGADQQRSDGAFYGQRGRER
jgi:hypothetical protein